MSSLSPVRGIVMTSSVCPGLFVCFVKLSVWGTLAQTETCPQDSVLLFYLTRWNRAADSSLSTAALFFLTALCVFVCALPPFCCVQPHSVMMPPPSPALPGINKQWAGPDARSSAKNSPAHQNNEQFPSCSQTLKWSLMKGLNKALHCTLPKCSNNTGMSVWSLPRRSWTYQNL